jgi:hypothetical protein
LPARPTAALPDVDLVFATKLAVARAAGTLSRRIGSGGGTTLPGRVLTRLAPGPSSA